MSMTRQELADELSVTVSDVDVWADEGLPVCDDGLIEFQEASDWLVAKGYAETPDQQINTLAELAAILEVKSTITATNRSKQPNFPPGPPWNVNAVIAWKEAGEKKSSEPTVKDELDRIKLESALLKLRREQSEVLDADEVIEELTRQSSLAKEKSRGLIPRLVQCLPADTDPRVVEAYRQQAQKIMDDFYDDLATAFRGGE